MIIVGYQGIGKSTLANNDIDYVDLESSNFFVDGKRNSNWFVVYCNIAESLSLQGYNVFVSSHDVVRRELARMTWIAKMIVFPSHSLKHEWLGRLERRYKDSTSTTEAEKNYKAFVNAVDRYDENICELYAEAENGFALRVICDMSYELRDIIEWQQPQEVSND